MTPSSADAATTIGHDDGFSESLEAGDIGVLF
jgi:hypothetical protein